MYSCAVELDAPSSNGCCSAGAALRFLSMSPSSTFPRSSESDNLVGFFLESLDDEHEVNVLQGAIAGAREASVTLMVAAGGAIGDPVPDRGARNFVFKVFSSELDGIVLFTSALASECGATAAADFVRELGHDRVVCAGVALPGYASVEVDSYSGTRAATLHLIEAHGARKLAFICGPESSAEVEERLRAFEETLQASGIDCDRRYILEGDYSKASGAAAIATLLDERGILPIDLDAVVGANDYMALGAMDELARRRLRIPEDVAVVGFDDVESSRLVRPTLTTVAQPAAELGRASLRLVTRVDRAEHPIRLDSRFLVRASCGCAEQPPSLSANVRLSSSSLAGSFVQRRHVICAELVRASRGMLGAAGRDWEERLLDGLVAELHGGQQGNLNRALGQLLRKVELSVISGTVVQELLTALRVQAALCVDDAAMRDHLEVLLHDARAYAASFTSAALSDRSRADAEKHRSFQRALRNAMFGANDALSQVAAEHLPSFGVAGAVVAALETPGDVQGRAQLVMGFGPAGRIARAERTTLRALLRHPLIERVGRALVVLPIVAEGQALGVALVSARHIEGHFLEDLADTLAAVIRGSSNAQWTTVPPSALPSSTRASSAATSRGSSPLAEDLASAVPASEGPASATRPSAAPSSPPSATEDVPSR